MTPEEAEQRVIRWAITRARAGSRFPARGPVDLWSRACLANPARVPADPWGQACSLPESGSLRSRVVHPNGSRIPQATSLWPLANKPAILVGNWNPHWPTSLPSWLATGAHTGQQACRPECQPGLGLKHEGRV